MRGAWRNKPGALFWPKTPVASKQKPAGPRSSPSSRRPAPGSRPATRMASSPRCRRSTRTTCKARRNAAWGRAGRFAAALLVLEPSSELAVALGARARTGEDLSAKLGKAKDAARRGKWRAALRIALAAVSYTHLRAHETRHDLVCRLL